ncbi:Rnase E [Mycobacterium phage LilMcDreamy]|uniref:DNA binding protein n=1 Tax=Mycobacterium phage LilMcDreamy TaxID=2652422 RepID=A0A5P8D8L9_9CAUD|nr:Rnase E [Mycobacterium phage LilMcDreamy]QFP94689.1 DNA binding protein [Mycobacterium phage LilMcDreamy]
MSVSDEDINSLLNEELFARRVKALFLSNAGATIAKIAEECGVSTATVRKDLEIAKRQYLTETPDQRRATQMSVILDMRKANYPAMMRGDVDAANVILRGLKQEASLFGLFPKVLEVPGIDTVQFANEAAALIERIAEIDPNGLKEITGGQPRPPLDVDIVEDRVVPAEVASPRSGAVDPGPVDAFGDPAPEPADQHGTAPAGDDRGAGGDDGGDDWSNVGD